MRGLVRWVVGALFARFDLPVSRQSSRLCEEIHKRIMKNKPNENVAGALTEGWVESGSFLGSVLAGALLGYLADLWLNTDPWLVVIGILLGSYSGFMRAWHNSKKIEENPRGR